MGWEEAGADGPRDVSGNIHTDLLICSLAFSVLLPWHSEYKTIYNLINLSMVKTPENSVLFLLC